MGRVPDQETKRGGKNLNYYHGADVDFSKPYRPKFFAERSKFVPKITEAPLPSNSKLPSAVGKYERRSGRLDTASLVSHVCPHPPWHN